jgi:riboflavin synthase
MFKKEHSHAVVGRCISSFRQSEPGYNGPVRCLALADRSVFLTLEDSLMFTGLVEEVGVCLWLRHGGETVEMALAAPGIAHQVRIGDSVAVNGCCLTVVARDGERLYFDLLEETLRRTNLGEINAGSEVNLERALPADGRIGGHFVQGHVDCTAALITREVQIRDLRLEFELPARFSRYVTWKGSICVNGVSLTVASLGEESFSVWIIPHTRSATNLGKLAEGNLVNLEFDILAKYAERILTRAAQ